MAAKLPTKIFGLGKYVIALFLFSIYFSTTLSIILSVIIACIWLFSGQWLQLAHLFKNNPVACWSGGLYLGFVLAATYSTAPWPEILQTLQKYRELLFIPILTPFFYHHAHRRWAWWTFSLASAVSLFGSFFMDWGLIPLNHQGDPCFKSRITHSILIAFFMFYCAHQASKPAESEHKTLFRAIHLSLAALCFYDLFFVVTGRTGQLAAIGLCLLFAYQRYRHQGLLWIGLAAVLFLSAYVGLSDKSVRIHEGIANTQAYFQEHPEQTNSSMGQRYTMWKYSLKLLAEKPVFGYGTGSFHQQYQRAAAEEGLTERNPHNEFLMIAVQWGILGLVLYFGFLTAQLRATQQLAQPYQSLGQGLLLTLIISSLFNSPFLDHTEGHWFATLIALCFARQPAT